MQLKYISLTYFAFNSGRQGSRFMKINLLSEIITVCPLWVLSMRKIRGVKYMTVSAPQARDGGFLDTEALMSGKTCYSGSYL
jgi:hypothetical protein